MTLPKTVVFVDLAESTRLFEAVGNVRATDAVTRLVQWTRSLCELHGGHVVKTLGDGVFAVFDDAGAALDAVAEMQRTHERRRSQSTPAAGGLALQIGVAIGEVVQVDGDCYGKAVNLASRLSALAGPAQIWVTDAVVSAAANPRIRHRDLGSVAIRGLSESASVHRIDWQDEGADLLTIPAPLPGSVQKIGSNGSAQIELTWLDVRATFDTTQLPIHLGRGAEAQFVVEDRRASRLHARIEQRDGSLMLVDLSSYGTWVRFHGSMGAISEPVALRRQSCALHGSGEIGLGVPLQDVSAPSISFVTGSPGRSPT